MNCARSPVLRAGGLRCSELGDEHEHDLTDAQTLAIEETAHAQRSAHSQTVELARLVLRGRGL